MSLDEDFVRLRHMLDAAAKVVQFTKGRTRSDLEKDEKLPFALTRLLEIIGEAANQTSQEFRLKHPDLPWRSMTATRNRLIHGYFDVDLDVIWTISSQDIPSLMVHLKKILE